MTLHTTPADRKEMVRSISEHLGVPAEYLRTPTYAYRIGNMTVERDGSITCNDVNTLEDIKPMLIKNGFLVPDPIEATSGTPDAESEIQEQENPEQSIKEVNLCLPAKDMTVAHFRNLMNMLYSMQKLLNKAIGADWLSITTDANKTLQDTAIETVDDFAARLADLRAGGDVRGINWEEEQLAFELPFNTEMYGELSHYAKLFKQIIDASMQATRVQAWIRPLGDNEKYTMHTWLIRIGCVGPNFKETRRVLTERLAGYCAFPDKERADRHKAKYAAKRKSVSACEETESEE